MSFAGDGIYVGLSGERPTAGIGSGTRFIDRGTGEDSYWDGSEWKQSPRSIFSGSSINGVISGSPTFAGNVSISGGFTATVDTDIAIVKNVGSYNSIIYSPISGTYISRKRDGTLLHSGTGATHLQAVVQKALDNGGEVRWVETTHSGGFYQFSNALSGGGVYIPNGVTLKIDKDASIRPANDFSGVLFRIDDFTSGDHLCERIKVEGGMFMEGGATPGADWDLFRIESASNTANNGGIVGVTLRDIWAERCRCMVRFVSISGTNSWINGNTFDNLWANYPKKGFVFEMLGSGRSTVHIVNRNHFTHLVVQGSETPGNLLTTNGFENIGGEGNQFINCRSWDIVSGQSCSNITDMAYSTLIEGGIMTREPIDWEIRNDRGYNTIITADPHRVAQNNSLASPFMRKTGTFQGWGGAASTGAVGDGLLNTIAPAGSGSISTPAATVLGTPKRMDTGSNSGAWEAIRGASIVACRNFNPFLKVKAQLGSGNMNLFRAFVGLASSSSIGIATGNNFLSGLNGFGIGYTSESGSNWWSIHNNGVGADVVEDTGITANTSGHIFYLAAYEDTPKVVWRIDNLSGQVGEATASIPGQFTGLVPGVWIANTSGGSRIADVHMMYLAMEPGPQMF